MRCLIPGGVRQRRRGRQIENLDCAGVEHGDAPAGGRNGNIAAGIECRAGRRLQRNLAVSRIEDPDQLPFHVLAVDRGAGVDRMVYGRCV